MLMYPMAPSEARMMDRARTVKWGVYTHLV